jgi:hypothetical protein
MANSKISELDSATTTDGTEIAPVVQGGATKKMALSVIKTWLLGIPNLFSRAQTIHPSQSETALTVRRATAEQTQDILIVQGQDNTALAKFDKDGNLSAPNATLSSGALTASKPFELSQTWNNVSATFTGIKLNVTNTASAATSSLMDLQVGGVSALVVNKSASSSLSGLELTGALGSVFLKNLGRGGDSGFVDIKNNVSLGRSGIASLLVDIAYVSLANTSTVFDLGFNNTIIRSDAANTLAQRNGVNAQTFRVYNTFTDASNYERGFVRYASNTFEVGNEAAGTGSTGREFKLVTSGAVKAGSAGNPADIFYAAVNQFSLAQGVSLKWGTATNAGTGHDVGIDRAAAGVVRLTNGSSGGGSLQLTEQTAPAAPATDNVRIYAEDNGSGKTRLMARFATGAAVQIAIEP